MIAESALFPGRVSGEEEEEVSVIVPELLFNPDQNVVPRLALSSVKVSGLPFAPLLFHVNTMLETVTSVYGFVIAIPMKLELSTTPILLAVIVLQLVEAVDVPVAVMVGVAVSVLVAVGVPEGIRVGVLVGRGVNV